MGRTDPSGIVSAGTVAGGPNPVKLARIALIYAVVAPLCVALSVVGLVGVTPLPGWEMWLLCFVAGAVFSIAAIRVARRARDAGAPNRATAVAAEVLGWIEVVVSTAGLTLLGVALYGLSNYRG